MSEGALYIVIGFWATTLLGSLVEGVDSDVITGMVIFNALLTAFAFLFDEPAKR